MAKEQYVRGVSGWRTGGQYVISPIDSLGLCSIMRVNLTRAIVKSLFPS